MKTSKNGFTLFEMAVVMVIIGLVMGTIFTGITLVRSARIRTMLGEYDTYIKAVNEFQDKFLALPGDMNNAESMWGTDPGGCPGSSDKTLKIATCNGDGSGTIGSSDTSANLSSTNEWFRAWQQLYDAHFITAEFTGTPGAGGVMEAVPGQNVPRSYIDGAGWTLMYYLQLADNSNLWGDHYAHMLMLGGFAATSFTTGPVLTANEALSIDQKIDDGNPGMGKVRAWRTAVLPNCTANDTSQTAQTYAATSSSALACSLIFSIGF